jgi:AcrR family transcriptional regulator
MARPREFDEAVVLDAAMQCFWSRGFEATSVKDLLGKTGITAVSLYNAFGDKRALFRTALDHYVEAGIGERIRRCENLPPREAIAAFFDEILKRSLSDRERKGCMLVNAALEVAPHDGEFRKIVARRAQSHREILSQLHQSRPSGRHDRTLHDSGKSRPSSPRGPHGGARPGARPAGTGVARGRRRTRPCDARCLGRKAQ